MHGEIPNENSQGYGDRRGTLNTDDTIFYRVRQVVVVESSKLAVRSLTKNLDDHSLKNVRILNKKCSLVIRECTHFFPPSGGSGYDEED
ncbi:MAG: hypothetical protein C5S49_02455 [Candidatus Methanogaster sp.]|nr:MAG: hypothetical protein C5S49_02410 [ANME-2 cluster archaeon]KAF5417910.1 MAG: hypothetical protein C5S49_02455 [ANME-2 cluster archaeon]